MSQSYGKLAHRYAKALLKAIAQEGGGAERVQEIAHSLKGFSQVWESNKELSSAICNPMFEQTERLAALREIGKIAGISDIGQRFIALVFERDRILALPEIANALIELADTQSGVVQVQVTVAQAVGDDERRSIEQTLSQRIKGRLEFSWDIAPEIIGGMVVRYSGKVVDGSVAGRLERIERRLMS